jgi:hypothetical protein
MRSFREIPALIARLFDAGRGTMRQTAKNIQARMMEEGKPVQYPIQWDSERQRRAFFATKGFGRGIPYRRTNRYRLGWRLSNQPFGASLANRRPAGAIGGTTSGWQSKIHRGRWNHLLTVLFEELSKVPTDVSNRLRVEAGK